MEMTNRISRRELLAASGVAPALAQAEAPKRPNFVLFMPFEDELSTGGGRENECK